MKTAEIQVSLIDSCGTDLSVVNAARVSFDKESEWEEATKFEDGVEYFSWRLLERDQKLIRYLARHKHTSPFNHCFASFRVKAPIFVARQLVKHKFLPWNEVSRRYVDSEPEFYIPKVWRKKAENVKQGSSEEAVTFWNKDSVFADLMGVSEDTPITLDVVSSARCDLTLYQSLLEAGVCPEQARMVLPQNTMTEWVWSGTLGAWADMCRLRLDPHAQQETREVAQAISAEMQKIYPESWKALMEN